MWLHPQLWNVQQRTQVRYTRVIVKGMTLRGQEPITPLSVACPQPTLVLSSANLICFQVQFSGVKSKKDSALSAPRFTS
jgi:hypothetical protein